MANIMPPPGPPGFRPDLDEATKRRLKSRDSQENRVVVRWIIRNSKQHMPAISVLMATSVASSLAAVAFALLSQQAVNAAVAKSVSALVLFAIALACCGVLQIAIRAFSNYWTSRTNERIVISYETRFFDRILTRDYRQITAYHSGDLINRITEDVVVVSKGITSFLPAIVEIVANLCGAGSVLLLTDWRFCLIYIVATLTLIVVNRVFRRKLKKLNRVFREKDGDTRSYFQDAIQSLLVLRVFVTEGNARARSSELLDARYHALLDSARVNIKASSIMGLSMNFGHIFALIWCSFQLVWGNISYGALVAIMQLTGQVRQPFISASNLSTQYYAIIASAERLMEIEELDPELTEQERTLLDSGFEARDLYAPLASIESEGLEFSYRDEPTLRNVGLKVGKGQTIAIMGQSGCGKSTLFKLILGMYRPDAGSLVLRGANGTPPDGASSAKDGTWTLQLGPATRRLFAYVPQGNLLISGRLRDNIAFACPNASDANIWAALEMACAADFVRELPDGLDTVIGEHGAGLSEGQMQRIAVARAYLSGAPIMLLDEATSSLDEATEAQLLANLRSLNDRTCIIVTHRRAALDICDGIISLQDGRVVQGEDARIA